MVPTSSLVSSYPGDVRSEIIWEETDEPTLLLHLRL